MRVRFPPGAPLLLHAFSSLFLGVIFQLGESYFRTVGIGVRVPVAPPGRAEVGGLSACNANQPHRHPLFVRRFAAEARSAAPELTLRKGGGRAASLLGIVAHLGERLLGMQEV